MYAHQNHGRCEEASEEEEKITRKNGNEFIVQCKYERRCDFCFRCGMLSNTERFFQKKFECQTSEMWKEWGAWLRAPSRRAAGQEIRKWLRDEETLIGMGVWKE